MLDLLVIGGGPAGYVAAERAANAGLATAVIEKEALGGVCLNEGCIPSKTLLNSARIYSEACHASDFGVHITGVSLDHSAVLQRKEQVISRLVKGVEYQVKSAGADHLKGEAQSLTPIPGQGYTVTVNGTVLDARNVLLATGSVPILPPLPGIQEGLASGEAFTSKQALSLAAVPHQLVVVGGGVIGLELAEYYATAGSQVTVVEMLEQIGGPMEPKAAQVLQKALARRGIAFHLKTRLSGLVPGGVSVEGPAGAQTLSADAVLLAMGRRASFAPLALEALGLDVDRGRIPTDPKGRTNLPGLFAAGDVNGKSMLAHTAYREAEVCVNTLLGIPDRMRYHAVPSVVYTHPEVASVGYTQGAAQAAGFRTTVVELGMGHSGRFVAENTTSDGFVHLVVDRDTRRLLGATLVGPYASEIIYGAAAFIEMEMRVEDIRQVVFPHPTVGELMREALFDKTL